MDKLVGMDLRQDRSTAIVRIVVRVNDADSELEYEHEGLVGEAVELLLVPDSWPSRSRGFNVRQIEKHRISDREPTEEGSSETYLLVGRTTSLNLDFGLVYVGERTGSSGAVYDHRRLLDSRV